jgi:hypothetical protein
VGGIQQNCYEISAGFKFKAHTVRVSVWVRSYGEK